MSMFTDILDRMKEIHDAKSRDYAGNTEFGNFNEAERVGVSGSLGAFIRLQDKYTRCCNLLSGAEAQVKDESVEDTLIDLANYAIIVLCLRRAEKIKSLPNHTCTQEGDEAFELLAMRQQWNDKANCNCGANEKTIERMMDRCCCPHCDSGGDWCVFNEKLGHYMCDKCEAQWNDPTPSDMPGGAHG